MCQKFAIRRRCTTAFGSREDAFSDTVRQKRWDPRWHEEDVAGRVLEQIDRKLIKGRVISIPAIAEESDPLGRKPGEYLWDDPNGYNYGAFLRDRQRETSPMMWSALYQQRPARSDYAVTSDGGDYTVHAVVGLDPEGRMYLLDLWRKQSSSDEWVEAFCDLLLKWKPAGWAEEKTQITSGVGPYIDRRQRERQAYCYREQFPTRGDKAVRAQSIRGRMALEGLHVPTVASWYPEFRAELLSFPAGKHDDQVDALGLIGQLLDQMIPGQKRKPPVPTKRDTGYRPIGLVERPPDWMVF